MSTAAPAPRWLFGPAADLLLGCGLGYVAIFALQGFVGGPQLAAWIPPGLLVMLGAIPHYGATLLRVYESSEDRRKYRLFAVHATLAVAIALVVGLRSPFVGSLVLTIYLTWSPWHYTGQNYGVFLMLTGRRGVAVAPTAKRWIYASFLSSYALTFLAIHGVERTAAYAPVTYQGTVFRLLPLGIPTWICDIAIPATGLVYVVATAMAVGMLVRAGGLRALLPGLVLMAMQSLWFSLPVAVRFLDLGSESGAFANIYTAYGFIWIAFAHSIQYLWVTTYYAWASRASTGKLRYLGKTVLAGYAIWTLPALLFAPGVLGVVPYESGLALMVAATVNLHHFILDGAIWKLRDGRVSRILLRAPDDAAGAPVPARAGFRWGQALVWVGGGVSLAVALGAFVEGQFGHQRALARGDIQRAREAARNLRWLGREGPSLHRQIGERLANAGQDTAALREFEISLELHPTAQALVSRGRVLHVGGRVAEAAEAYEGALELEPDRPVTLYWLGIARLDLGDPESAIPALERAVELDPGTARYRLTLDRAERAAVRARKGTPDADSS